VVAVPVVAVPVVAVLVAAVLVAADPVAAGALVVAEVAVRHVEGDAQISRCWVHSIPCSRWYPSCNHPLVVEVDRVLAAAKVVASAVAVDKGKGARVVAADPEWVGKEVREWAVAVMAGEVAEGMDPAAVDPAAAVDRAAVDRAAVDRAAVEVPEEVPGEADNRISKCGRRPSSRHSTSISLRGPERKSTACWN
jgi:hypothetical protein